VSVLKEDLAKVVNDASRKVSIRGNQAIVPLKFDEDGEPATFDKTIYKRVNRNDLRFLALWQETDYSEDIEVLRKKTNLPESRIKWFCNKLDCFKQEDLLTKAVCKIPSVNHIKARLHINSYTDELTDGQRDSLKELAKIGGAYKNVSSVNVNVVHSLKLPALKPEEEAELRRLGDSIATTVEAA
jgi:hypothetical protein